ncbi:unnamed protein product [Protopolystoma xenopodis]|uniref:Uncharacterized protein n=1 Tax=Protopolystoma xenopodis TaxID=117903 RepID=A0A448X6X2_9PLAT|nr:unnamed protein product [Protopolystoma xenopodis]
MLICSLLKQISSLQAIGSLLPSHVPLIFPFLSLSRGTDISAVQRAPIQAESELLTALDRLILYLRIVHSFDFYAPAVYFDEQDMPHPCGLIHVRPALRTETGPAITANGRPGLTLELIEKAAHQVDISFPKLMILIVQLIALTTSYFINFSVNRFNKINAFEQGVVKRTRRVKDES